MRHLALKLARRAAAHFEGFWWRPVDARPYALTRVAFAVAAMANLIELWPHRLSYLADSGMIDLPALRLAVGTQPYYSLYWFLTTDQAVTASVLIAALAMISLGLGFFSRTSAVIVFAWQLSYCHRAFPILHSWDGLLRNYAFLCMVSPIGRVWSADAWLRKRRLGRPCAPRSELAPAFGLRLMQWQLVVMYVSTFLLKVGDRYWANGELVAYFNLSLYGRFPDDAFHANHIVASNVLTFGALAIEACLPALLLGRKTRHLGFALGWGLHIGIGLSSKLSTFSLCAMAPYFAFLRSSDLQAALQRLSAGLAAFKRLRPEAVGAATAVPGSEGEGDGVGCGDPVDDTLKTTA